MATGLLVIRMSRPLAAKPAANWVMKVLSRDNICPSMGQKKNMHVSLYNLTSGWIYLLIHKQIQSLLLNSL